MLSGSIKYISCPHVSGLAALLKKLRDELSVLIDYA